MTYLQAVAYLNSFVDYEKKGFYPYRKSFRLERIEGFLRLLGNPQEGLRCLHIAGTKGKGSVCVFLAYILREAGFKAGLYTSPHLVDFRERVRVLNPKQIPNSKSLPDRLASRRSPRGGAEGRQEKSREFEGMISKKEITDLVKRLKPLVEEYNLSSKYGDLTFFEVYTALAFLYFKEKKTDYAVLETGLGGRLDATNTVNPLACAITPISPDHTAILGKRLFQIAREKAGIIKSGKRESACLPARLTALASRRSCGKPWAGRQSEKLIVVSAPQEKEAREVIQKRCKDVGAKLYEAGKDILWSKKRISRGFQIFNLQGLRRDYNNLRIKLLGVHQLDNAALAVGLAEALNNPRITASVVRRGLKNSLWPGRLELVSEKPAILLDGAQNAQSAGALACAVKAYFKYKRLILVLGISADKDIKGICDNLCSIADRIILTKADNPRAAEPVDIKKMIAKPAELTSNVKAALKMAKSLTGSKDLILIAGSLFIAGEARKKLKV